MDNKEFFEILSKNINYIVVDDTIISGGTFDIRKHHNKYSSSKEESNALFYDDSVVKTKNTYVNYCCEYCNRNYTILLKKYLNKNSLKCVICKEQVETKKQKQSEYMVKTFQDFNKIKSLKEKSDIKSEDYIRNSNIEFEKEKDDFKRSYFEMHLNNEEFTKILSHIYSINSHKLSDNITYYEHLKTNNQMKYSSYIYDIKNDLFINFNNVEYTCECCDIVFKTSRKPIERISNKKFLCRKCSLSNKTFKVRSYFNIENKKIVYQSSPELKLIEFCNKNAILIENGPKLKYFFNNKFRTYSIDFYIPKFKYLIEIKDNHIWHKGQIDSGQWAVKETTARNYAKLNKLQYKLIFTQYLDEFLNTF